MFAKHGELGRVVIPPAGVTGIAHHRVTTSTLIIKDISGL